MREKLINNRGITIVSLVVTIIILLILAGISLGSVFGKDGIFKRATGVREKYNEAKARETLEIVLLDAQYEKYNNIEYNQDGFLDEFIKNSIPGSDVRGDVAIVDIYAYELDRSVPRIGRYLGLEEELVFPTINATATLSEDKKNSTINITASENKNGINKIEIWLLGEKIEEYIYNPANSPVTENYTANQNGEYTIKAYGELMDSKTVEVTGILASVKFEPNGNAEWKKEHSTTVTIEETADKVVKSKYVWTNSVTTPNDNQFPEEQTFNSGDLITGGNETMTGTYYLWIMIETQSGEIIKRRSEGFKFDNEGPTIISFNAEKYSGTGITLNISVKDTESGVNRIEFYIDNILKDTKKFEGIKDNISTFSTINDISTGEHLCKIIVYDSLDNYELIETTGETKMYTWEVWNTNALREEWNVEKTWRLLDLGDISEDKYFGEIGLNVDRIWKFEVKWTEDNGGMWIPSSGGDNLWADYHPLSSGFAGWGNVFYGEGLSYDGRASLAGFKFEKKNGNISVYEKVAKRETVYGKGETYCKEVKSSETDTYPSNGELDGFWYVSKGLN